MTTNLKLKFKIHFSELITTNFTQFSRVPRCPAQNLRGMVRNISHTVYPAQRTKNVSAHVYFLRIESHSHYFAE